jgi:Uncharacterized protein conserved in bacteria (DUF2325)
MGRNCCNTSLTAPGQTQARSVLTADSPRPPLTIRSQDAHHFSPSRTKIWELAETFHCSVIGTCLSTADLRKILTKLGFAQPSDSDHDLHSRGVGLASQNTPAAKRLHKALDDRHELAIRQFGRANSDAEVRALWQEATQRGDIPGPYWALLTHPSASYGLVREAFGHVHMLSHLVGSANRADIRRLAELEDAKAALEAKVERQQAQLHSVITERDRTIQDLQTALSARIGNDGPPVDDAADHATLQHLISALEHRLAGEARRRASLENRLAVAEQALEQERRERHAAQDREQAITAELAAAEASLQMNDPEPGDEATTPRLDGVSLLYVGGRPHQVAALRSLGERLGATFNHHDGGIEEQSGRLAGLAGRADIVLFPVDCVSHEAALAVKRLCRQYGKPFVPLRSGGQGAFLAALAALPAMGQADPAAA